MLRCHYFYLKISYVLTLCAIQSFATLLPVPSTLPAVTQPYDSILLKTWTGMKKRMIDPYSIPLVHRPRSEKPDDAVSEGVGYGMFCALYCNDQTYFNKIWDAAEQYMWAGSSYNWRVDKNGTVIGLGPAVDAEEDIACALIFADMLVKRNIWQAHTSPKNATYAARAQSMVDFIWGNLVQNGKYLMPGANWGGAAFVNPGYFAPAFYRVFSAFCATAHDWTGLIDQCYRSVALSPGDSKGLVPDWMKPDGSFTDSVALGYNSYGNGNYCYKDGIRVLWRLATDYQWNSDARAKTFLDKAYGFVNTPDKANFYQMNGSLVPGTFALGNGVTRPRAEHSHLTLGMWATAAMASGGKAAADSFSLALLEFYSPGADYFGKAVEPGGEDTLHNEMYFDQFLAWFGASLISGVFTNLFDDLSDSNPALLLAWKNSPVFSTNNLDANVNPLKISGTFNKSARWTVTLKQNNGDSTVQFAGSGETLNVLWYGLSAAGKAMPSGWYTITIGAKGLTIPVLAQCWLGRALDLKVNNRLMVDTFRDKDLVPYIGSSWQSYLDSYEGKSGKSTITAFAVQGTDTAVYLQWAYLLSGSSSLGYDPYAALEWNCELSGASINLTGLDTIVVVAKSVGPLRLSVQLVTSDITDYNFFQDSLVLSQQWTEYRLPLKSFKTRFSGSAGTISLSKLTAIRFQIQNKDNSTGQINLKRMLFSGSLGSLYVSPPPYIQPTIGVRSTAKRAGSDCMRIARKGGAVRFFVPEGYRGGAIAIVTISGKEIRRLPLTGDSALWDGLDSNKSRACAATYIAVISGPGGLLQTKMSIVNF